MCRDMQNASCRFRPAVVVYLVGNVRRRRTFVRGSIDTTDCEHRQIVSCHFVFSGIVP